MSNILKNFIENELPQLNAEVVKKHAQQIRRNKAMQYASEMIELLTDILHDDGLSTDLGEGFNERITKLVNKITG